MILVNEKTVPDLVNRWMEYAYENSDSLMGENYSKLHKAIGRGFIETLFDYWADDESFVTMDDFYVSDMMSIVENVGAEGKVTDELKTCLKDVKITSKYSSSITWSKLFIVILQL